MTFKFSIKAAALAGGLLSFSTAPLKADIYILNSSTLTGSSFGTVTVTPDANPGELDIQVTLNSGYTFAQGGDALGFNLANAPKFLVGVDSSGFTANSQTAGSFSVPPYGNFQYVEGTSSSGLSSLRVVLTAVSSSGFVPLTTASIGDAIVGSEEVFFAAQIDDPTGQPGVVAAVAAIPEASTWAMMILGFFGLGFIAYRERNTVRFDARTRRH
jgi:hypothetical protein